MNPFFLLRCEMTFLIRGGPVWNVMLVEQTFCESTGGGTGRNIGREGKFIFRIHVYSSEDKSLPLLRNGRGLVYSTCHQLTNIERLSVGLCH